MERFLAEGRRRKLLFRRHGVLWSVAIGASVQRCIRELSKLYDRALHYHAHVVGVATPDLASGLFPFCERTLLLSDRESGEGAHSGNDTPRSKWVPLNSEDLWERALDALAIKA
jgi:hypothetical protein